MRFFLLESVKTGLGIKFTNHFSSSEFHNLWHYTSIPTYARGTAVPCTL